MLHFDTLTKEPIRLSLMLFYHIKIPRPTIIAQQFNIKQLAQNNPNKKQPNKQTNKVYFPIQQLTKRTQYQPLIIRLTYNHYIKFPHHKMRHKFQAFIIIVMPIIAAFNYVVAHKLIDDAALTGNPRLYEQFYFVVVSTGIFHLFWMIMVILIFMKALEDLRLWKTLTTFLVFETVLLYGLGVYFALFLCEVLYQRDAGNPYGSRLLADHIEYYVTWSAVCVGCLWATFIVFLMLIIKHVYKHEDVTVVKVEDASRMP